MGDFTKFRTSIGGFNRVDVSDYMTRVAAEHQEALRKEEKERARLAQQLDEVQASLAYKDAQLEQLQKERRDDADAMQALEVKLVEAEAALKARDEDYASLELEAYRRAEATERLAAERSSRIRQQLTEILDGFTGRCEVSGQKLSSLTQEIRTNLTQLEEALSGLQTLFSDTAESFSKLDEDPV